MTALRAAGLRVAYGPVVALHGIDLEVEPGRLVSVTGPSGAGKTSLLWAPAGALDPGRHRAPRGHSGHQSRAGRRPGHRGGSQGNALAHALTAHENVLDPLLAAGVKPTDAARRTTRALGLVGLEESSGHMIEELSGGQQQRVALARAFAAEAHVLLATSRPATSMPATGSG